MLIIYWVVSPVPLGLIRFLTYWVIYYFLGWGLWTGLENKYSNQTQVDRDNPRNLDSGLWTFTFFYGLRMTQGYQLDQLLKHFFDNVLLVENSFVFLSRVQIPLSLF